MNEIQHRKRHGDESGEYFYGFRAFKNLDDALMWRQTRLLRKAGRLKCSAQARAVAKRALIFSSGC